MNIGNFSGVTKAVVALGVGGVLAGAIALGANGGGGSGAAPPPQVAATTTNVLEEPITDRFNPSQARQDCPDKWLSYIDPDGRFSFCYPSTMSYATERPTDPEVGLLLSIGEPIADPKNPQNIFAMTISWSSQTSFLRVTPSSNGCTQQTGTTTDVTKSDFFSKTIDGRALIGCDWRGKRSSLPSAGELRLESPFARDGFKAEGFIRVRVDYVGPDLDGTRDRAQLIIDTIRLP